MQKNARLLLIISTAIFGTLAPFVRNIPLSSGELALCRAVMAAGLVFIYLLAKGEKISFSGLKKELALLLVSGMAMGINWILLFEAYKYTSVSVATLSYYFAPVLVTVISPFLFGEKLGKRKIICFVMSTIGLIMVLSANGFGEGASLRGVLFGLGAAGFYATVIILNKMIKEIGGIKRTFMQFIAAIIVLIPYVAATGGLNLGGLGRVGIGALLIVGLVHTGVTYCMYFSALKELPGQEAAILSYIDPLVAVIISVLVLHEPMNLMQIVGGVLILGFMLLNELGGEKESPA
ncbi:MAG: EamA family transporter [Firmicutes bacterium]|nr:EamA family transporter [Bacillota bacterium]